MGEDYLDRRVGWQRLVATKSLIVVCALAATVASSHACVGTECMNIWSTEDGAGSLTMDWDFTQRKVQTFRSVCAGGQCLYSAIDPGFRAPDATQAPSGYFSLDGGTTLRLEVVSIDPAATFRINGTSLRTGDSALLGTTPDVHTHPSWQLSVPDGQTGDYALAFKLTAAASQYGESTAFSVTLTNLPTPTPDEPSPAATPTPTPTAAPPPCAGDCDGNDVVAINELVGGVTGALGTGSACAAFDVDANGTVSIAELVAAVNAALNGCSAAPTPTATAPATLDTIQTTIFSPRCAIPTCHDAAARSGNLTLEAGAARAALVGVAPNVDTARAAGLLLVDPGRPENSFILAKLEGPPPDQGSRMPLTGGPLTETEIRLIRNWIARGAEP